MKRVQTFDFIRALATIGLVILHSLYYQWTGVTDVDPLPGEALPSFDVQFLSYIIYLAGLFFMISGAVQAMTILNKAKSKKYSEKLSENKFLFRYCSGGALMGVVLLIYHFAYNLLFNPLSGQFILLLKEGASLEALNTEEFYQILFHRDAPSILGLNFIFVSIVAFLLFRNGGWQKRKRNLIILAIIATSILVLTPFVRFWLFEPGVEALKNQQWLLMNFLTSLYDIYFPVFPYTGFALYGMMMGIILTEESPKKLYKKIFIPFGLLYFIIGLILLATQFGGLYFGLAQYPNPDASLFDIYDLELVRDGMYFRTFLNYNQLGLAFLAFYGFFHIFDFVSAEKKERRIYRNRAIFRLGNISLTVFIIEGVVRLLWGHVFTWIYPTWNDSLYVTFAFGVFNVVFWIFLAWHWSKINYVGSLEWIMIKLVLFISGRKSQKFQQIPVVKEILLATPIIQE
jgi:hypothetical protein